MKDSSIVINTVSDSGNGYIIEEISSHDFYSTYLYSVYKDDTLIESDIRINIIDAIRKAESLLKIKEM